MWQTFIILNYFYYFSSMTFIILNKSRVLWKLIYWKKSGIFRKTSIHIYFQMSFQTIHFKDIVNFETWKKSIKNSNWCIFFIAKYCSSSLYHASLYRVLGWIAHFLCLSKKKKRNFTFFSFTSKIQHRKINPRAK